MVSTARLILGVAAFGWACASGITSAPAQSSRPSCVLIQIGGTSRQVLKCGDGLTITPERGAKYTLLDRNRDGKVDAARLQSKAILLDAPKLPSGFEVITPQAIAAVRGTKWAVDTSAGTTAVFVIRGAVEVSRPQAGKGVVLRPGEGVDVDNGSGSLVVKRWPAARASALLARLGQ
ncbi:FecR domain-containing protein [Phyllobacterium sp. SB3]|uniref:FecR domain-containing protein n=1 Tax=Phyllobacterium sp. SB3 TaxID=3156073 RepID=UPI0032AF1A22